MASTITKYASVLETLGRPVPTWVTDVDDQVRVAAYDAYDDMYNNVPQTFRVAMRGTNDKPIYVPSTKRIVEATNRYLGKGWAWTVTDTSVVPPAPGAPPAQPTDVLAARNAEDWLKALYKRTRAPAKFYSLKRNMVKKGDGIFHVVADLSKPAGKRIRILELNPRSYFRIEDPTDPENLLGVYIVNLFTLGDSSREVIATRLEYRYAADGSGRVGSRLRFFESGFWDDRWPGHPELKEIDTPEEWDTPANKDIIKGITLPASVTTIPVYHAVNNREDEDPWGSSEARGIETLIAAVNQGASDEDLTIALQGLGMYVTNSTSPIDPKTGEETDWVIAPGYVLELRGENSTFTRVPGVEDVDAPQAHLHYLAEQMDASSGVTATAVGNVDVTVAASGIALRLDMAPILAKNEEKEIELLSLLDQMSNDLVQQWAAVDGMPQSPKVEIVNSFADPLPVDRAAVILEVTQLLSQGLMSKEFAVQYIQEKLGFQFPTDMLESVEAAKDSAAQRAALEMGLAGLSGDPTLLPPPTPPGVVTPGSPPPGITPPQLAVHAAAASAAGGPG